MDYRSSSEGFLILAVIANHFLLESALWAAAEGTGECQGDQARNARELLGLEEVALVAAGAVELVFTVALVDNDGGALGSGGHPKRTDLRPGGLNTHIWLPKQRFSMAERNVRRVFSKHFQWNVAKIQFSSP